jgi:S-(hydroxymethyl)glutathione dehydrogenase/alcohol dehydrogenase
MISFPWMAIRPECRVQTSRMGSNRFRVDIPRYLEFYRQGRLLLDEMVTHRRRLGDINDAFQGGGGGADRPDLRLIGRRAPAPRCPRRDPPGGWGA